MAVFTPAKSFEGSDLSSSVFGKLIRDGIRLVNFREDRNQEGNFFFLLPPYKLDQFGRGVSWKVLSIRDNFGLDVKESFVIPRNCPVNYFASKVKQYFPDFAKVEQAMVDGRSVKRYPSFGRAANKVVFNVAYMSMMQAGAHVLLLPQYGGAEHIEAWGRRRMADGSEAPLLNNPDAAIPIFIQLKKKAQGMPWVVTPDATKTYKLPLELSDSAYLYNLDEVAHYPEIDYLIEKLKMFTPTEIFNKCIAGYQLPNGSIIGGSGATAAVPTSYPVPQPVMPQPVQPQASVPQANIPSVVVPQITPSQMNIPQANIPPAVIPQINTAPEPMAPTVPTQNLSNPMAAAVFTPEQAKAYLLQPRNK